MRDEIANDPVLRPFVEALTQLPPRDPALVARILTDTAQAPRVVPWWERWRMPTLAITALGAAVLMARGWPAARDDASPSPVASSAPATASGMTRAVAADGSVPALLPVRFSFIAPEARSVQLVGDFNAWDGARSAMARDEASGAWVIELSLAPGRHVYAFVVDSTQWMADPTAPRTPDDDFGKPGSVLMVRAP
jgi:hypothetical protein